MKQTMKMSRLSKRGQHQNQNAQEQRYTQPNGAKSGTNNGPLLPKEVPKIPSFVVYAEVKQSTHIRARETWKGILMDKHKKNESAKRQGNPSMMATFFSSPNEMSKLEYQVRLWIKIYNISKSLYILIFLKL